MEQPSLFQDRICRFTIGVHHSLIVAIFSSHRGLFYDFLQRGHVTWTSHSMECKILTKMHPIGMELLKPLGIGGMLHLLPIKLMRGTFSSKLDITL